MKSENVRNAAFLGVKKKSTARKPFVSAALRTAQVAQYLRVTMIERAEHLSLRYHSHARTGDAIYRIYQDSAMITSVIERVLLEPVVAIGQVVFSFIVIWLFSPILDGLYLAGMLPILWLVAWFTPRLQMRSRRARTTNSALTSRIQEAFVAIRIVKANRAERIMGARFDEDSRVALDAAYYLRVEFILMRALVMVIAGTMIVGTQYLMAGWTIAETPTFLVGAVALVGFSVWNLGAFEAVDSRLEDFIENGADLIRIWGVIQDMGIGLDRAFFLLDLKPDIVDTDHAMPLPAPIREILFERVAFGYDPAQPVLKGVDLKAETGTITAIVGGTGSGKSTLMSLLLRLYDPDAGTIRVNGTPLAEIRIESLRAGVAIALQQNTLFATTVADNIAYAKADASRLAIEFAAKVACADALFARWRRVMTRNSENAAASCPPASASACPSPGPSFGTRRFSSSMNPPRRWMRRPNTRCCEICRIGAANGSYL